MSTEQGLAIKARSANVSSIPESERWDADRILGMLGMLAVPWFLDPRRWCLVLQEKH